MKDKPHWIELCQQISVEQDPDRFTELVTELNRLLDDKKERLRLSQPKPDVTLPSGSSVRLGSNAPLHAGLYGIRHTLFFVDCCIWVRNNFTKARVFGGAARSTMSGYGWHKIYHEALLETDWSKIEERIQSAEAAMKGKLHEFSLNRGGTPEENHLIDDAMNALNVLKREVTFWKAGTG